MIHRSGSVVAVLAAVLLALPAAARAPASPPPLGQGLVPPLQLVGVAEDPVPLDQMGAALEVQGNYLFVGAPGDARGRVDVWYRAPAGYLYVQQLRAPASIAAQDDQFGRSLAADGGVLVVGTRTGTYAGRAVVFRRAPSGLYAFEQVLAPSSGSVAYSLFAERLAVVEGALVAATAPGSFAVHVFEADASGRFPALSTRVLDAVSTATLPSSAWSSGFGSTIAAHRAQTGEVRLLVGMRDACFYQSPLAPAPDETTPNALGATAARTGCVAVLQQSGAAWLLAQRLIPDFSKVKDFGFEIEADGARVAVGGVYSRVFSNGLDAGTASVYEWTGASFELLKTIWPKFPQQAGLFGYSLAFSGDYLLVGQPQLWGGLPGLVELFRLEGSDLVRVALLAAPDGNAAADATSLGDSFGRNVVCNDHGEVIVAAPFSAPNGGAPPQYAGGALYLLR